MLNVEVLLRENMEDFFEKEPCFPFQHSQWAEGLTILLPSLSAQIHYLLAAQPDFAGTHR